MEETTVPMEQVNQNQTEKVKISRERNAAIFRRQAALRKENPALSKKEAYWMARKEITGEEQPKKEEVEVVAEEK